MLHCCETYEDWVTFQGVLLISWRIEHSTNFQAQFATLCASANSNRSIEGIERKEISLHMRSISKQLTALVLSSAGCSCACTDPVCNLLEVSSISPGSNSQILRRYSFKVFLRMNSSSGTSIATEFQEVLFGQPEAS